MGVFRPRFTYLYADCKATAGNLPLLPEEFFKFPQSLKLFTVKRTIIMYIIELFPELMFGGKNAQHRKVISIYANSV